MPEKISVVIHTYNCENIIKNCLETVKDFDEIILCDMYSTDKTLEIAKEYGCKIVMHKNVGYADPARNYAISHASNEWVLVVDSDEEITKELKEFLYNFIKEQKTYNGLKVPRLTYCWGEPLEVLYPDYIVRFFRKEAVFYPKEVHGTPVVEGNLYCINKKKRNLAIVHMQERSISGWIQMINQYTDLECEKWKNKDKRFNFWFHSYKSLFIIIEKFFFKNGYKNGIKGFIISVLVFGFYKFLVGCKYWEYKYKNK